jgi:hydroxymethylpyrimidine/phosphomethylpyrimidine kinase
MAKAETTPVALTIAGFDPSSGAGVTADLKVFAAHHTYGMACITALTVQSTLGVRRVEPVASSVLRDTLACLYDDIRPNGVKLGMLATREAVEEISEFLGGASIPKERVVLDPVLRSSSGKALLSDEGVQSLRSRLLSHVGWITPNLDELAILTGVTSIRREEIPEAAAELQRQTLEIGNPDLHVLVTGGHLDRPDDFLRTSQGEDHWLSGERVETNSTHGTGCALSSALLCQLIAGKSPREAAMEAKAYVTAALKSAYPVGRGKGPMHHLFGLERNKS